ncbi:P-loop containing nucleoside triphosphate hydrolase protein [Lenzites betulinus]|nr:P-loop containing nucleoside triphosphate hydrolase protein [Lenzites betulinus]
MAASLWSKSLALFPAARICRCSASALALHALRAGRVSSVRHGHAFPAHQQPRHTHIEPGERHHGDVEETTEEPALPNADQATFESLKDVLSPPVLRALTVGPFKLKHMSPVQAAVLPLLPKLLTPHNSDDVTGPRDLLVKARTGTGKTLAFLVPAVEARLKALQGIYEQNSEMDAKTANRAAERFARDNVGALILSPTRELATQIANEAIKLTKHLNGFEVRLLVGGLSKRHQMREWNTGRRDIVVATPGRLRDCIENDSGFSQALSTAETFILDEADTLLDMGFREDIQAIVDVLKPSPERQTFMFSATVSKGIQQIAQKTLAKNHEFINCVPANAAPTHLAIPQYYTGLPSVNDQIPHILRLIAQDQLAHPGKSKVLLFLPTTNLVQLYSTILSSVGAQVLPAGNRTRFGELHSKMSMNGRIRVSDWYRKEGSGASVMVTSDVSARGVDYPGVTRVIQVGIPSSGDVYVHRVGRTGRANMSGRADIVLMPWELGFLTWQLRDIPLKELTTNQLKEELATLVEAHDNNPNPTTDRRSPLQPNALARLETIDECITALQEKLDADDVRSAMVAALAFYFANHEQLRVQRGVVAEGAHAWAAALLGREADLRLPREFTESSGRDRGFKSRKSRSTSYRRDNDRDGERRPSNDRWGGSRPPQRRPSFGLRDGGASGEESDAGSFVRRERRSSWKDESGDESGSFRRERRSWGGDESGGERKPRSWDGESGGERKSRSWGGDESGGERKSRSWGNRDSDGGSGHRRRS